MTGGHRTSEEIWKQDLVGFLGMWNNRGGRIFNDDISKITNLSDLENMFKI